MTSIEELVEKYWCTNFLKRDFRAALTEQAASYEQRIETLSNNLTEVCVERDNLLKRIRELEAQRVPEWQPIETAPKPYADVLVKGDSGYAVAYFDADEDCWVTDYRGKGNWQPVHALHWLPLPAAPAPKEGE